MKLPAKLTLGLNRNMLILRKQSPHIFFVAGVVGTVVSTVMACRATLKLSETLDEVQADLNNVKDMKLRPSNSTTVTPVIDDVYTNRQHNKDLVYVYVKASVKITKLYGPSVIVSAASIAALTKSHVQLTKRNAALMAAYAIIQQAYEDYRERVRDQLGTERELELHRGIKTEVIKNEEGKNEEVKTFDPNKLSEYARFFNEFSDEWVKDAEMNMYFLKCQQSYANNRLKWRGHLFLNEVYDSLGLERTKAGAIVGWVIGKDGDNFVDFGIYEARNTGFVSGWERCVLLDFNVDGVIWDKI